MLTSTALLPSVRVNFEELRVSLQENKCLASENFELMIKPENDLPAIKSSNERRRKYRKSQALDLNQTDFIGSIESVKQLILLPYSEDESIFAFHRIDNALMIEKVPTKDFILPTKDTNTKYQSNNDTSHMYYAREMEGNDSFFDAHLLLDSDDVLTSIKNSSSQLSQSRLYINQDTLCKSFHYSMIKPLIINPILFSFR
jgi:hypothetical protein